MENDFPFSMTAAVDYYVLVLHTILDTYISRQFLEFCLQYLGIDITVVTGSIFPNLVGDQHQITILCEDYNHAKFSDE